MLYTIPHNVFPDLNYFSAPFCMPPTYLMQNHHPPTEGPTPPITSSNYPFFIETPQLFVYPRKVKVQILNPLDKKTQLISSSVSNFQIISHKEECKTVSNSPPLKPKDLFCVSSSSSSPKSTKSSHSFKDIEKLEPLIQEKPKYMMITNKIITEFNTNPKLKKIHSTYHLKRKVTTKFQNDIKNYLNKLIASLNMKNVGYKLPFVSPNSKNFREDVKIDSLRKFRDLTIGKYISEDINDAGRSLNMDNIALIEKIDKIYQSEPTCELIKELYYILNRTIVSDYYNNFLHSERFKKCFVKDIEKYCEKLNAMNFSDEKKVLYKKIFKEKYEGIANSYFAC